MDAYCAGHRGWCQAGACIGRCTQVGLAVTRRVPRLDAAGHLRIGDIVLLGRATGVSGGCCLPLFLTTR